MPMLNLDFSSVADREPLEPGFYHCRISAVESKESQKSGNPMLVITYDVVGDAAGNSVAGQRKLWDNLVLTEAALWKVKAIFSALGIPTEEIINLDTDELVGRELGVKVVQEVYDGENRNYTKGYVHIDKLAG